MNRYDIDDCGDEILDPDGGWVKYEDHDAEIARLKAELDAAKAAIVDAHFLLDKAGLPSDDADWKEWISRFDTWVAKYRTAKENPNAEA